MKITILYLFTLIIACNQVIKAQTPSLVLTSPDPMNSTNWSSSISLRAMNGNTAQVRHLIMNQNYLRIMPGVHPSATNEEKKVVIEGNVVVAKNGNLTTPAGYSLYVREGILSEGGKVTICDNGVIPATPAGYNLYVTKGILTEKVKVAIHTTQDWSDYVFAPTYKLKPLKDLEQYIKANKHLPEVPNAANMVANGLDVAKTDALLLKKIEELTLYVIEIKKENELLKKQMSLLISNKK